VQDGDANVAVGVYVRVPYLRYELHLRGLRRVVLECESFKNICFA
jgi:hypothetical protein